MPADPSSRTLHSLLLLLALVALPTRGFRRLGEAHRRLGEAPSSSGNADVPALAAQDRLPQMQDFGRLPKIEIFQKKWERFRDRQMQQRLVPKSARQDSHLKMVIGVFTTLHGWERPYRDVIRNTWMQNELVCSIEDINDPRTPCKIFVTFVAAHCFHCKVYDEPDITTLHYLESMNCGKSQLWFDYAVQKQWPATHIAKMDMDAYLDADALLSAMSGFSTSCPHVYGGRSWTCLQTTAFCPPAHCGLPLGQDFFKYNSSNPECFSYMQGGFYFMSLELARGASRRFGWWEKASESCMPEDAIAGKAVYNFGLGYHACVSALNLKGTGAVWHTDNEVCWWNDTRGCYWHLP